MKWILIGAFAIFIPNTLNAMTPPDSTNSLLEKGTAQYLISEGKRFYNEYNYKLAIIKFREALVKDKNNPVATYWLGECHYSLGNYEKAVEQVEAAIALKADIHVESSNLLGLSYHRLGELDKAIEHFTTALGLLTKPRAKELKVQFHLDQCKLAKEMMAKPVAATIKNLSVTVNSGAWEYSAVLSPSGKELYFVSRRADNKGGGTGGGDFGYYEDIYVSLWDDAKGDWGPADNTDVLVERLNSYGFDAISQISADGETLYLTVNTSPVEDKTRRKPKTRYADLFVSRLNSEGNWNTPKSIGKPVNGISSDVSSCVSPDGKVLYFISDRLGGKGGSDIWYCYKVGKGWSKPENMGDVVNTSGQETTVWAVDDQTIYFSSTGHPGMGGYDVFMTQKVSGKWTEPKNLGYPINTVSDETHFKYYTDKKKAYYCTFSSESNKGAGARDIFEIDMTDYKLP